MSLDERLPDLLSGAATAADAAPPSRAGVQTAIGRRAKRRRRQRIAGSALAGLCVVAGLAGGIALSGDDEGAEPPDVPVEPVDGVPILGIDRDGWDLVESRVEDDGAENAPTIFDAVTFRTTADDLLPYVQVIVAPSQGGSSYTPGGPIILSRGIQGRHRVLANSSGVNWEDSGQFVAVIGMGVPDDQVQALARTLSAGPVDLASVEPPAGFPDMDRFRLPQAEAVLGYAEYRGPDGTTLTVEVTDMIGWIEFALEPDPRGFVAENTVEVAENPIGPGRAILRELPGGDEGPTADAYWRTPGGFSVNVGAKGDAAHEIVRDLLANGGFVLLDEAGPRTETPPTTTTAVAPVTTGVGQSSTSSGPEPATEADEACATDPGSPLDLAAEPVEWLRSGTYDRWRDADGCAVRVDVIASSTLAAPCGWQSAHAITISTAAGEPISDTAGASDQRRYLFNFNGVVNGEPPGLAMDTLPASAEDTGFETRFGTWSLWEDRDDPDVLYVQTPEHVRVYWFSPSAGSACL
jgi:hypothetical protein